VLTEQYRHELGRSAPPSEVRSWERSLQVLSADLVEAGLSSVEALVEYQLPLTSKRADVVLCGYHPKTGKPSFVVVELKQWSSARLLDDTTDVVILDGMGERLHPVEQVRRYCTHLTDFVAAFDADPDQIAGVAYLHNATDLDVNDLWALEQSQHGRLFTGQRRGAFLDYLRAQLSGKPGVDAADILLNSAVRPSKQLMALAAEDIQQRAAVHHPRRVAGPIAPTASCHVFIGSDSTGCLDQVVARTAARADAISAAVWNRSPRVRAQAFNKNCARSGLRLVRNVRGSWGSTSATGRPCG